VALSWEVSVEEMLTICLQDGEEEISHVGNAEPHQGMEEGKSTSTLQLGHSHMLTQITGWKAKLDQVPEVDALWSEWSVSLIVHLVIPLYFLSQYKTKITTTTASTILHAAVL
jgi:hypothetical protein